MDEIRDQYGRTFKTLRISLLDRCNFGCLYCTSGVGEDADTGGSPGPDPAAGQALSTRDLLRIIAGLHKRLDLHTIRLTGGEPLLYKGLTEVIAGIRAIGIPHIKLTTNGFLLGRQASSIKAAGMDAVNVSLDAIDEEIFYRMCRRPSAARVIEGIDAALREGLQVKINTVMIKNINEGQILPLLAFAQTRGTRIRFLEVMSMGHLHGRIGEVLVPQERILQIIALHHRFSALGRSGSSTARYWQIEGGPVFGVIANESEPFCRDCDRLRIDSQGNLFGCLSSNDPIPLQAGEDETIWDEKLRLALQQKQPLRFTGSDLSMMHIGG